MILQEVDQFNFTEQVPTNMARAHTKPVSTIWIHCAATNPSHDVTVEEIDQWHKDRGWEGIGYHWLIRRDGEINAGRNEDERGAHVLKHNNGSIGVCLAGGRGSTAVDDPYDHYTAEQMASLTSLIEQIKGRHPIEHVRGHNEVAKKACPGFDVADWLGVIERPERRPSGSYVAPPQGRPGVAAFQDNNGLKMTGILDETTYDRMFNYENVIGCEMPKARLEKTKAELAMESTTAGESRKTKRDGQVIAGGGAVLLAPQIIDMVTPENLGLVDKIWARVQPIITAVPWWVWVVVVVLIGWKIMRQGDNAEHSRWKDHIEGRHTDSEKRYMEDNSHGAASTFIRNLTE